MGIRAPRYPTGLTVVVLVLALLAAVPACDRNLAPFDPSEEPRTPDLSEIFPAHDREPVRPANSATRAPGAARGNTPPAATGASVHGRIELGAAGGASLPEASVLFIIVRREGISGGPPLAVRRIPSPRFPLDFEIGPDDVMIPSLRFEGPLRISARLDSDGNAMTRLPGDLQGVASGGVSPGARDVVIVLDEKI